MRIAMLAALVVVASCGSDSFAEPSESEALAGGCWRMVEDQGEPIEDGKRWLFTDGGAAFMLQPSGCSILLDARGWMLVGGDLLLCMLQDGRWANPEAATAVGFALDGDELRLWPPDDSRTGPEVYRREPCRCPALSFREVVGSCLRDE